MTKHLEYDCDTLPDKSAAREFYAKYEPKEVIGRGISSTVRLCIEKETGQKYAAKIIDINDRVDNSVDIDADGIREATMREIRILRIVAGHSYIIELHDVFESSAFIFLIFELCRGGELFDYLTGVVSLSEKKTRYIMKQIFQAVKYIHEKNVVHRDLKPENILLDDDLNVKITDFGFAEELRPGQKLFEMCGTPGYLAPEVLKCNMYEDTDGYSYEVDNWACGVIMYILLVGYPPFWHRKQIVMLRNIMDGQYSFNSSEWNDISELPKDLIRKLLVVDPKSRISIDEALNHDFFNPPAFYQKSISVFNARKKFRYIILVVMITIRIQRYRYLSEDVLNIEDALTDPYRIRTLRKVIDACAFGVYAHWVKKSDGQNRAALFENSPKIDLKQLYINRLNQ